MSTGQAAARTSPKALLVSLSLALATAVFPAGAGASTAEVRGETLVYEAATGEDNRATISRTSGGFVISDAVLITPGAGCVSSGTEPTNWVTCSAAGVSGAVVELADRNDSIWAFGPFNFILRGGAGNDGLIGDAGEDVLEGGDGLDTLMGNAGDDLLDGGYGADTADGGTGTDWMSYATRPSAVAVTLDDSAGDGAALENDNVRTSVENVYGGAGNDTLVGSGSGNRLLGGLGDDSLQDDAGNDLLEGGAGDDLLVGGLDDDTLTGGAGIDGLRGDGGADTLDTRDVAADNAECGADVDSLVADSLDTVAADCEQVATDEPAPGSDDPGTGDDTPAPDDPVGTEPGTDPGTEPGADPDPDPDASPEPQPGPAPGVPLLGLIGRQITATVTGVVPIRVQCPAASIRCHGRVVLTLHHRRAVSAQISRRSRRPNRPVRPHRSMRISRRSRPKKKLGGRKFAIKSGHAAAVPVKLSRHGRKLLRRRGRLTVKVSVLGRTPEGKPARSERVVTVRSARRSRPTRLRSKKRP